MQHAHKLNLTARLRCLLLIAAFGSSGCSQYKPAGPADAQAAQETTTAGDTAPAPPPTTQP